jgi:hypothetical protein
MHFMANYYLEESDSDPDFDNICLYLRRSADCGFRDAQLLIRKICETPQIRLQAGHLFRRALHSQLFEREFGGDGRIPAF